MPSVTIRGSRIASVDFSEPTQGSSREQKLMGLTWNNIPGAPPANPPAAGGVQPQQGAMVVITGDNGSGKTLLLDAFHDVLDQEYERRRQANHPNEPQGADALNHVYIRYNYHPSLGSHQFIDEKLISFAKNLIRGGGYLRRFSSFVRGGDPTFGNNKRAAAAVKEELENIYSQADLRLFRDDQIAQLSIGICLYLPPMVDRELYQNRSAMSIFTFYCDYYAQKKRLVDRVGFTELTELPRFHKAWTKLQQQNIGTTPMLLQGRFRDEVAQDILGGQHPIDMINEDIRNHFPYDLYDPDRENLHSDTNLQFVERGTTTDINPDRFSSGEKMILTVLSWKYTSFSTDPSHGTAVVLLDEADKHFGPKLLEQYQDTLRSIFVDRGVQVIMSTHRPDMVSLADDSELFILRRKRIGAELDVSIKPCNRLLALSRLTRNLSGYYSHQTRVFTEGFDDANFYNRIYDVLKRISFSIRQMPAPLNRVQERLRELSFRYQMQFHAGTDHEGQGGDCASLARAVVQTSSHVLYGTRVGVPRAVIRGSGVPRFNFKLFRQYRVDGTFMLTDGDYHQGRPPALASIPERIRDQIRYDRMVLLPRHSLESFHFDPLLLCSLFSNDAEIDLPFTGSDIEAIRDIMPIQDQVLRKQMKLVRDAFSRLRADEEVVIDQEFVEPMYRRVFELLLDYPVYTRKFKPALKVKILEFPKLRNRHPGVTPTDLEQMIDDTLNTLPDQYYVDVVTAIQANTDNPSAANEQAIGRVRNHFLSSTSSEGQALRQRISDIGLHISPSDIERCIREIYPCHLPAPTHPRLKQIYDDMRSENEDDAIRYDQVPYHYLNTQGKACVINLPYPVQLKKVKGHDLEDTLIEGRIKPNFTRWILNRIEAMGEGDDVALFIPNDLVDVFLELSARIKTQLVSKADPEKLQARSHTVAQNKGYYVPRRERTADPVRHRIFSAPPRPLPVPQPAPPPVVQSDSSVDDSSSRWWCHIL